MKVIVCLDDNSGMLFNKRRQSRDVKVLEDMATLADKLWIGSFSEKLFECEGAQRNIVVQIADDFLNRASKDEYCFVENEKLLPYQEKIEQLIAYKWNRKYPSDFKLDLNLNEWKLVKTLDFAGNSHEKITKEIYVRK